MTPFAPLVVPETLGKTYLGLPLAQALRERGCLQVVRRKVGMRGMVPLTYLEFNFGKETRVYLQRRYRVDTPAPDHKERTLLHWMANNGHILWGTSTSLYCPLDDLVWVGLGLGWDLHWLEELLQREKQARHAGYAGLHLEWADGELVRAQYAL